MLLSELRRYAHTRPPIYQNDPDPGALVGLGQFQGLSVGFWAKLRMLYDKRCVLWLTLLFFRVGGKFLRRFMSVKY